MKFNTITVTLMLVMVLSSAGWITSCRHEANIADFPEVCFETDVLPLFLNNCAKTNCHDGNGEPMRLTLFSEIRNEVEPGKPYSSNIYKAITATSGEGQMPPGQPLSIDNRTIIRIWIEQGATNPVCPPVAGSKSEIIQVQ